MSPDKLVHLFHLLVLFPVLALIGYRVSTKHAQPWEGKVLIVVGLLAGLRHLQLLLSKRS